MIIIYLWYILLDSDFKMEAKNTKLAVDKEELKKRLTPLQYQVTQEAATERPFTGTFHLLYNHVN